MYTEEGGNRIFDTVTKNVESVYKSHEDSGVHDGRNASLLSEILFSNNIQFTLPGLISRKSKAFITIDASNGARNNTPLGNLLYGQWLITNMSHNFTPGSYTNSIVAAKPYTYKKPSAKLKLGYDLDLNVKKLNKSGLESGFDLANTISSGGVRG